MQQQVSAMTIDNNSNCESGLLTCVISTLQVLVCHCSVGALLALALLLAAALLLLLLLLLSCCCCC
jgi:hypothetical protein